MGSATPSATAKLADANPTVAVEVSDGGFRPKSITITPETLVRFNNVGTRPHTITADTSIWDSGELPAAKSVSVFFAKSGTFTYRCTYNPDTMRGTVIANNAPQ